jgi:streptogramin lyase
MPMHADAFARMSRWLLAAFVAFGAVGVGSAGAAESLERFYAAGARHPTAMAPGPDGAVWFTWDRGFGRVAQNGRVTLRATPGVSPTDLEFARDGTIWFTDSEHDLVGVMRSTGTLRIFTRGISRGAGPNGIGMGPDGNAWFTEFRRDRVARITRSGSVTEFGTKGLGLPGDIVAGPDGNLWFTSSDGVGSVTPQGSVTAFHLEAEDPDVQSIAVGPDGNLWVAGYDDEALLRITTERAVTRMPLAGRPVIGAQPEEDLWFPESIVAGPDGNLWFTYYEGIGRIAPDGSGLTTWQDLFGASTDCDPFDGLGPAGGLAFAGDGALWAADHFYDSLERLTPAGTGGVPSPVSAVLSNGGAYRDAHSPVRARDGSVWLATRRAILRVDPDGSTRVFTSGLGGAVRDLALGRDGAIWFTQASAIGRIDANGRVRHYRNGLSRHPELTAITRGPQRSLWFVEAGRDAVGRITASGVIREYRGFGRRAQLYMIAAGRDGRLWVTDQSGAIFAMTVSGHVRRFSAGLRGSNPVAITAGPDGHMWFTELRGRQIGRITASGRITEYRVREEPVSIVSGPDGALWFTTVAASAFDSVAGLGRITTTGRVDQFYVHKTCGGPPRSLVVARDGSIWMTMLYGPVALARIDVDRLAATRAFRRGAG